MALTYTLAGLQTELDALVSATDSEDLETARKKLVRARSVLAGLPSSTQTDGATLTIRHTLDDLAKLIEQAERDSGQAADNRRIIRLGVRHV